MEVQREWEYTVGSEQRAQLFNTWENYEFTLKLSSSLKYLKMNSFPGTKNRKTSSH